jgi:putative phosphoesterase
MRIAIISDIHGNLTAFEAVLSDLHEASPDLVLHGGDLADAGSSPEEIVDRIRDLGWRGVAGNTDEMLLRPESLEEFAAQSSAPASLWNALREIAAATRVKLGEERIAWLRQAPCSIFEGPIALVHASPKSLWHASASEAKDTELESVYGPLERSIVVYGHIHRPYIRALPSARGGQFVVVNSGSVGLPYDGDHRASYLLVYDLNVTVRRIEYDKENSSVLRPVDCRTAIGSRKPSVPQLRRRFNAHASSYC